MESKPKQVKDLNPGMGGYNETACDWYIAFSTIMSIEWVGQRCLSEFVFKLNPFILYACGPSLEWPLGGDMKKNKPK